MARIAARSTYGNDQSSGGLTATAGRWASGVGQAAASASDRVGEAVKDLPGAGQAQRSVRAIADTVSNQDPLLLAAVGLAFGTALGAMLPGTRLEDETFGGVGKSLRQAGEAQLEAGLEKVKEVAGNAVEAAEKKAEESGLLPTGEGPTVAERLSDVADTTVEAARNTLRGSWFRAELTEGTGKYVYLPVAAGAAGLTVDPRIYLYFRGVRQGFSDSRRVRGSGQSH